MKSRSIIEIDMAASLEANLKFLDNVIEDCKKIKKRLLALKNQKPNPRQRTIDDEIEERENE